MQNSQYPIVSRLCIYALKEYMLREFHTCGVPPNGFYVAGQMANPASLVHIPTAENFMESVSRKRYEW
jgi:hypothetical protein